MRTDIIRKTVLRTVLWSTAAFFLILGGIFAVRTGLPRWREARVERLLERGDITGARDAAARVADEAAAQEYLSRCDYMEGAALLESGDVSAARSLFARCGAYSDAQEQVLRCDYLMAEEMAEAGDWDEAAAAFAALGGYADSADRVTACRYEKALALFDAGEKTAAGELFSSLGDYRDAPSLLRQIAMEYTSLADPETALQTYLGLSGQEWERLRSLEQARASVPRGIVDVGFCHTVGLAVDGTVLACGDDSFGQCGVSGLRDAAAVAAGAYHTAVLFSDGTVKAVGRSTERQCDTRKWRNVIAVAAADYATFGLTDDGKVLCAGYNKYTEPKDWTGLTGIFAGSYNLAALRADGTLWIYPRLAGQERLDGCVSVAVNTGYAVGIGKDGRAASTAFDLDDWHDIIAVDACATAVLGLDVRGRVCGHFFRDRDAVDLSAWEHVVALAAGGTHHALVMADGTVTVLGDISHGEGLVSDWVLAVNKNAA